MSSPILDSTLFYSTLETFPTTIADNNPVQHSLIPHYHVKHPKWYFDDADLFFTQRGVLFGLHQHKFNNPHFSRRLNHIEPCRTAAMGTVSSLPISLDALSILPFITFIRLLYWPNDFSTDVIGWNQNKGFGYDLGLCRYHAYSNAENTNGWFQTSFHYTMAPIMDHCLGEILGRRNYRW